MRFQVFNLVRFKRFCRLLSKEVGLGHCLTMEKASVAFGYADWHHLTKSTKEEDRRPMELSIEQISAWRQQLNTAFNTEFDNQFYGQVIESFLVGISARPDVSLELGIAAQPAPALIEPADRDAVLLSTSTRQVPSVLYKRRRLRAADDSLVRPTSRSRGEVACGE